MWVRGLKPVLHHYHPLHRQSHPVWVRGLKLIGKKTCLVAHHVAPRVGAWIETPALRRLILLLLVAPRVGAWIETAEYIGQGAGLLVAPRVGAWIETLPALGFMAPVLSHPVWVRGLKHGVGQT